MQESQETIHNVHTAAPSEQIGFPPQAPKSSRGIPKSLLLGVLGLLLIGGAAFFVLRGESDDSLEPSPTPDVQGIDFIVTPQPTSFMPTATPQQTVDKSALDIQILNGTGIPGEAGYLETQLKSMGFTKTQTGNASGTTVTATTVTYSSDVPQSVMDEINTKLEGIYKTVEHTTSSSASSVDVKIIVGLRKGATPRSGSTSSSAASSTPRPTGSGTPKATSTGTPRPTATPSL